MNSIHAVSSYYCKINWNVILPCKAPFLSLVPSAFLTEMHYAFLISSYVPYSAYISYFLISSVQYYFLKTKNYKVLSMFVFCLPPVTLFLLGECVFLNNLFSNTFSLRSSRSPRCQFSHTLKKEKLRLCIF